jgi:two-component system response regulator CpxR
MADDYINRTDSALLIVDDDGELRSMLKEYLGPAAAEAAAEDSLTRAFSARELVACITAVLRNSGELGVETVSNTLQWGPLRLDFRGRRAQIDGCDLGLTSAELRILEQLMRAEAKPVTRAVLTTKSLGRRLLPTDRSLDTHVSNLRRKIARVSSRVTLKSVRGTGYALALI